MTNIKISELKSELNFKLMFHLMTKMKQLDNTERWKAFFSKWLNHGNNMIIIYV